MSKRSSETITSLIPAFVFLLLVLISIGQAVFAQTTNATLSGVVEDQDGKVVPGVKVTLSNEATGLRRTVITDRDGAYVIPLLPPATYTVLAEATGFRRISFPNIVLNVNDVRSLRIELQVGEVGAEVLVNPNEGVAVKISSDVSTVIDRTFVQNMPLNGRSFSSLVLLTPGVTVTVSGGADIGQFSVNGQRPSTNAFSIDGVGANIGLGTVIGGAQNLALAGAYPGTNAFGGTNNLVSIDALEEFKVQTSTYSAESGRQPGGQIQILTRSGKNQFQGSLFEYFRNEALDARQYFNFKPAPQTPLRQNNFGGTLGGPILFPNFGDGGSPVYNGKDRSFFFFSYEGQRLSLPISGVQNVPSARLRQRAASAGSTTQPLLNGFPIPNGPEVLTTTNCPAPPAVDPRCDPSSNKLFSGFAPYNYSLANTNSLDATSLRIDHTLFKDFHVFGRFNESPSDSVTGNFAKNRNISSTRTLTLGSTWIANARLSNEFRFNYSRQSSTNERFLTSLGGAVPFDSNLITSGYATLATLTLSYGGSSSSLQGGTSADFSQRQINIVDNLSYALGSHQLKFGIDFRRLSPIYKVNDQDLIQFSTEAAVVAGSVSSLSIVKNEEARPQFDNFSSYFQDSWKVSDRLTLDLGLRWEFNPPPTEAEDRLPLVVQGVVGTDVSTATVAAAGTPLFKTFYNGFAPRVGAAYQLVTTPGRETVIRGGIGVYYDLGNGTAAAAWPFAAIKPTQINVSFPISPAAAARPVFVSATTSAFSIDKNLKLPYSLQWNLTVEQTLGKSQAISLAYVASAGRGLLARQTLNLQPRDPQTGQLLPRPNPNFGGIFHISNGASSDYHSMQAQYRARLKNKLQALVNYTWSHAIDESSSDILMGVFERGNANFDVRHNVSAAVHYDLPSVSRRGFLGSLSRDLSFDAIVHAQSGRPLDVTSFVSNAIGGFVDDRMESRVRPDLVPGIPIYLDDASVAGGRRFNTNAFRSPPTVAVCPTPTTCQNVPTRQGNFGRNVLRELATYQVDLALGRKFMFSEKLALQLKAEVFNVFNHPMFSGYNLTYTSANFGIPTQTLASGLGGLSALYQMGGPRSVQLSARLSL